MQKCQILPKFFLNGIRSFSDDDIDGNKVKKVAKSFIGDLRTEAVSPIPFEHNHQHLDDDEQQEEEINSPENIPDEKKNRNRKKDKKNKKSKKKKKSRRRSRSKTESDEFEPAVPVEGSPVSSDPDFGSHPAMIRPGHPVEETSPISSEGSVVRRNGRDFSPRDDFDRPRRPPQTPPEPSPEGDLTPIGDRSPLTPTFGRQARGPRTPEGPSPPPMERVGRLGPKSPPSLPPSFMRSRGAPRTPEGSPLSLNNDDDEAVMESPPRPSKSQSRDRHGTHHLLSILPLLADPAFLFLF
jgi:hypothetical protein